MKTTRVLRSSLLLLGIVYLLAACESDTIVAPASGVSQADYDALLARVEALETELADARGVSANLSTRMAGMDAATVDAQSDATQAISDAAGAQTDATQALSETAALDTRVDAAETGIADLEDKTQYMSVNNSTLNGLVGPHVVFTGANIHIRSGEGCTNGATVPPNCITGPETTNGRGNLIIGYDEAAGGDASGRGGSHNLVLGSYHQFTSYGGFVAGIDNAITGPESTVSGGQGNIASGLRSSVSGGGSNTASGYLASVSGGAVGTASGDASSVSGGQSNTASANRSSVSGGNTRSAASDFNWVAGSLMEGF